MVTRVINAINWGQTLLKAFHHFQVFNVVSLFFSVTVLLHGNLTGSNIINDHIDSKI